MKNNLFLFVKLSLCSNKCALFPQQYICYYLLKHHIFAIIYFLFLINTYIMTGAPTIGVTTFKGNIPPSLGREHSKLHNKAIKEPLNSVTGNSFG